MKVEKNSSLATLRLMLMACFVERKISGARMAILVDTARRLGLPPASVQTLIAAHEAAVLTAQETESEFFFGDGAFPKALVHDALDAIEHVDLQLQTAYQMMQVILAEPIHTGKEYFLVESAVAYWDIKEAWHEVVEASQEGSSPGPRAENARLD